MKDNEIVIGHVGRFSTVKNHEFLLDVFNEVQKRVPAKLLLVGDGDLRLDIENKAQKLGIADRVILTGVRSDVANLLQAMDVFLFPSLFEGLGIAIVEAQNAGLPCVISERIPQEGILIDELVTPLSLAEPAEKWADTVLEHVSLPRADTQEQIKARGFDIKENARWLEEFYLEHAR